MAFIPVENAAQITLQFSQHDGSFAENEFWVQRSIAWDTTSLLAMAAAFKDWWENGDGTGNKYRNLQYSNTDLVAVGARDFTTESSDSTVYNTGLPLAGDGGGPNVPLGLTWSVTARTGLAGRSFRGRTYIVDPSATLYSSLPDNQVDGTLAASAIVAFNALIAAVPAADADATLVVCSRRHNNAPRVSGLTTPIIAYGYHNLIADFQRRRAPAHNRHH